MRSRCDEIFSWNDGPMCGCERLLLSKLQSKLKIANAPQIQLHFKLVRRLHFSIIPHCAALDVALGRTISSRNSFHKKITYQSRGLTTRERKNARHMHELECSFRVCARACVGVRDRKREGERGGERATACVCVPGSAGVRDGENEDEGILSTKSSLNIDYRIHVHRTDRNLNLKFIECRTFTMVH